ncbi:MAG: MarR family winged helix-turn-helix transcriptional regulator [Pseudomonadota bacterium]
MNALDLHVFSRLQRAAHQTRRIADKALQDAADITTSQAAVLAVVSERKSASQKQTADLLGLKEPAVAAMVARLVKLGYLGRRRSVNDGRAWELYVTDEGGAALAAVEAPFARINRAIEDAVGDQPMALFAEQLQELERRFGRL